MKIFIKKYASLLLIPGMFAINSCDDFSDVNVNPNATYTPTPEFVFSKSVYDAGLNSSNHASLLLGNMQYLTSYNDVAGFGSKYVAAQQLRSSQVFSDSYPNQINEIEEVVRALQGQDAFVNQLSIARIWRVFCYHRLTDVYGDIPYSESAQGYLLNFQPVYTSQEDIYADMLKELQEATAALSTSGGASFGSGDVIYRGNIEQWRKFGYSLMLRLGMRLTEVASGDAETWVKRAIAGGVIMNEADIAAIRNYNATGQTLTRNPLAYQLLTSDYSARNGWTNTEGGKYQETFIDSLKDNQDPRLSVLAVVWQAANPPDSSVVVPNSSPGIQRGMADNISGSRPPFFRKLSEPNPATVLLESAPLLLFTTQEVNFLLAEAAVRGWYTGATAEDLFEAGIRAGLHQWEYAVGAAGAITPSAVEAYVTQHPFATGATNEEKYEQIYTQFWMGAFPDATEVFNTYRRLGYPALTPNNYPGNATGGKLIRRFMYPTSEQSLNTDSYSEAVQRQKNENLWKGDDLNGHVWWDVHGR
jgi:hypothetical protein